MLTNPRDAFRGQSRSPNMVPFDMLGIVAYYCSKVTVNLKRQQRRKFWDIRLLKMLWPWSPRIRSLQVIGTDTDRSATYDFLLTSHSNHEPILHRFPEKRRLQSKIAIFPLPWILRPPDGVALGIEYWRFGTKKLEWYGATGPRKKFDDIFSHLDTMHQRHGRTDRRTPGDSKDRAFA